MEFTNPPPLPPSNHTSVVSSHSQSHSTNTNASQNASSANTNASQSASSRNTNASSNTVSTQSDNSFHSAGFDQQLEVSPDRLPNTGEPESLRLQGENVTVDQQSIKTRRGSRIKKPVDHSIYVIPKNTRKPSISVNMRFSKKQTNTNPKTKSKVGSRLGERKPEPPAPASPHIPHHSQSHSSVLSLSRKNTVKISTVKKLPKSKVITDKKDSP